MEFCGMVCKAFIKTTVVKMSILLTEGPINIVSSEISQLRDKETFKF